MTHEDVSRVRSLECDAGDLPDPEVVAFARADHVIVHVRRKRHEVCEHDFAFGHVDELRLRAHVSPSS